MVETKSITLLSILITTFEELAMLLLFSSTLVQSSEQRSFFISQIEEKGISYIVIDTHDIASGANLRLCYRQGQLSLLDEKGYDVEPTSIYMMNLWRTDTIIRLPQGIDKPQLLRHRIHQFLTDIRFAFEDCRWIPGRIEHIEGSDSKIKIFKEAYDIGLDVPTYTYNSWAYHHLPVYKKGLGYPFSLSYSSNKKEEVATTTTNRLIISDGENLSDNMPWQWQAPIFTQGQVRCQVVEDRLWSVIWKRVKTSTDDYRYLNELTDEEIVWKPYELPTEIEKKVITLIQKRSLMIASPEFLIDEEGRHIFIDLNACGDWYGFFPDVHRKEIAHAILDLCC